ncbi:hypothetical protein Tco_0374562 [Tanacetum coccineum]
MGDGHINTTPETETISVDEPYLTHLAPISPEIVEACVDDDDTDDDDVYDFYVDDCVDIEEDGGEIDLDISKIVDISLREKLVKTEADVPSFSVTRYSGIEDVTCVLGEDTLLLCFTPLMTDDSSEYESFTMMTSP